MGCEHNAEDVAGEGRAKILEAARARLPLDQRVDRLLVRRARGFTKIVRQPLGAVGERLRRQPLHQTLKSVESDLPAVDP